MKALIILFFSIFLFIPASQFQEINGTSEDTSINMRDSKYYIQDLENHQNLISASNNKSINLIKEILIPIGLSVFSGFVFWVAFQYIPFNLRKSKLRPKIEDDLLYINNTIGHLVDLAMRHAESSPSMFHTEIGNNQLTMDTLHIGLMNKALNQTFLVNNFSDNMVIGELIYQLTQTINTKIDRIFYFNDQLSADEILVLEKIHQALYKYQFSDFNRPYLDTRDGGFFAPVDPSLSYLRYFFFEMYQIKKNLEKILVASKTNNKSILLLKVRYFKNNKNYKKAIKIIKNEIKNKGDDPTHLKWFLFSILYLVDKKKSFILLKDLLASSNIITYRGYLREHLEDKEVLEFVKLHTTPTDYEKFIQNEALEKHIKQTLLDSNSEKLNTLKRIYNRALN